MNKHQPTWKPGPRESRACGPTSLTQVAPELVTARTRDYYNYSDELYRRLVAEYDVTKVPEVELQPGIHCDLYRCPHCYGLGQVQMPGLMRLDDYRRLFDEIHGTVPMLNFGGISTEPSTHPDFPAIIRAVKEYGFVFGMHTKGYRMDAELRDAFTDHTHKAECYITVSLDASDGASYIDVHDIAPHSKDRFGRRAEEYFDVTIENLKELHKLRDERGSTLRINVAYLLVQQNYGDEHVERVVELLQDHCDLIRFSIPQIRNDGVAPGHYLAGGRRQILEHIESKYRDHPKVRVLTEAEQFDHSTHFEFCYAQVFQAVVDKAGYVFPCPQTALKNYRWLAYGNVRETPFLEILRSAKRLQLLTANVTKDMRCRICDRKDEATNVALNKLFGR